MAHGVGAGAVGKVELARFDDHASFVGQEIVSPYQRMQLCTAIGTADPKNATTAITNLRTPPHQKLWRFLGQFPTGDTTSVDRFLTVVDGGLAV